MKTKYSLSLALKNGNSYKGENRYWFERNDCSVIALAYAFDIPYPTAHSLCAKAGRKDCNGFSLESLFIVKRKKHKIMMGRRIGYHGRPKATVGKFQKNHSEGIYIIRVGNHIFTMIDGVLLNQSNKNDIISYYYYISKPKQNLINNLKLAI